MAEEAKKAAPKRNTTTRKTAAKRKPAARKAAPRKATARKAAPTLRSRVTEAGRNAFLANLGFYGMAFDQVQGQLKSVETELTARRKKADKLLAEMIKRGEKVEKEAKSAIDGIEMPKLEVPALDRAKLDEQLEKAKARFEELKNSVGFKAAA
ncbi:MAG: hypothetical protein V2I82_14895 [Halieaceae bacterium]|nr:hypothetical protein [Halieaceae bacterium]